MILLEALKAINVEVIEDSGICGRVEDYLCDTYNMDYDRAKSLIEHQLHPIFASWPEFSGHPHFPVPSPDEDMNEHDFYMAASDHEMWSADHPYGAARRRLLEYCINQLENPHA